MQIEIIQYLEVDALTPNKIIKSELLKLCDQRQYILKVNFFLLHFENNLVLNFNKNTFNEIAISLKLL